MACLDGSYGWGDIRDRLFVDCINELDDMKDKLNYVKSLYLKDKEAYFRWKKWCMKREKLPDIFGTLDNPIEIDEEKL